MNNNVPKLTTEELIREVLKTEEETQVKVQEALEQAQSLITAAENQGKDLFKATEEEVKQQVRELLEQREKSAREERNRILQKAQEQAKKIQQVDPEKINAIVKTLDIEDSVIEKIQRAIPEAKAIMLLSTAGIPITELLSNLDIDTAQLAAVSSALSLPTRVLGGESKSIAVTGEKNLILLYSLDAERILMVTLKPKKSVESYLTIISRTVSH